MLSRLTPYYALPDIYHITPTLLAKNHVLGVLLDLDGTAASRRTQEPADSLVRWIAAMREAGISVMILSNNSEKRVELFCRKLGIPFLSRANKPFARAFREGARKLGLSAQNIAVVGDQIYTDTAGGNRFGALTIYVNSIDHHDLHIWLRFQLERYFVWRGRRQTRKKLGG